ncbi:hypothetical protein [Terrisporobacter glycolicus]|uniref:SipL SPOCS domain-containing protein n=1 Tax=Terrisporobacter glycolicus ATCC 14880 = DSM 1288 TaxID=1121315 RepID=A0ABZ2EZ10_9FIRM|nr:hypothetical protein [Terrisporobacter glycolicus]
MQDLKKNKRKMNNKQMSTMSNRPEKEEIESVVAVEVDELDRGCKCNNDMESHKNKCNDKHDKHECECHCECKKHEECKECEVVSEECSVNPCREECCNGIRPTFSTRNASPVAIETNRIFDSIQFRAFTDATGPNGQTLFFDFEVIEVRGNVPSRGLAKVIVDEVCVNFEELEICPGDITVDDFIVTPVENNSPCDTVFESIVCPRRNANCCAQNKGQNVLFRERGLAVRVEDLVLEIRGHCGCTKIVALAFPAVKRGNGQLCRVDCVEFKFNTLASNICCPSSGRSITLRQDYLTKLTVDCISNAFISAEDCFDCDCDRDHDRHHDCDCDCDCDCDRRHDCDFDFDCFEFTIPSGIDLILCVEETVSALLGDQLVVLAETNFSPRVVDTFANVCKFPGCGE